MKPRYGRILLKLSGEALMGGEASGVSAEVLRHIVAEVRAARELGTQLALVCGGGNIVRGENFAAGVGAGVGVDRVTADYMGMLATVINGMALQSALSESGVAARLQTALNLEQVAAPYIREKAIRHLEAGRVVIFAGGTGNPYFTTDTAASLRAAEIGAEALLKATKVDGVYSGDPAKDASAVKFSRLTFDEAIRRDLRVMDATALTLCRERRMPIHVFNLGRRGALADILQGGAEGTLVAAA